MAVLAGSGSIAQAIGQQQQQQQQQPQQQQPQQMAGGAPTVNGQIALPSQQGLPPTGLQQQMGSLNQFYQQAQQGPYGTSAQEVLQQQGLQGGGVGSGGQMNIQQMAKQLAQQYGLPMGRGELVDQYGNFQVTPEQLAAASGGKETMGMASAKMNMISQAIADQQNRQQQAKGVAAISAGIGLVQSRARGSLAAMQSGFYQDIADLYSNQEHEAADFSFFIEEERRRIEDERMRKAEKAAKKKARFGVIAGGLMAIGGLATGNVAAMGQGLGMVAGSAGDTEWF